MRSASWNAGTTTERRTLAGRLGSPHPVTEVEAHPQVRDAPVAEQADRHAWPAAPARRARCTVRRSITAARERARRRVRRRAGRRPGAPGGPPAGTSATGPRITAAGSNVGDRHGARRARASGHRRRRVGPSHRVVGIDPPVGVAGIDVVVERDRTGRCQLRGASGMAIGLARQNQIEPDQAEQGERVRAEVDAGVAVVHRHVGAGRDHDHQVGAHAVGAVGAATTFQFGKYERLHQHRHARPR